jgi:hypothetical protein
MFYQLATKQDFWKERLNLAVLTAPVAKIDNVTSPYMYYWGKYFPEATLFFTGLLKTYHILSTDTLKYIVQWLVLLLPNHCLYESGWYVTRDYTLDDVTSFQNLMGHWPSNASVQSMFHYGQMMNNK